MYLNWNSKLLHWISYILLDVLVCNIYYFFNKLCRIFASKQTSKTIKWYYTPKHLIRDLLSNNKRGGVWQFCMHMLTCKANRFSSVQITVQYRCIFVMLVYLDGIHCCWIINTHTAQGFHLVPDTVQIDQLWGWFWPPDLNIWRKVFPIKFSSKRFACL